MIEQFFTRENELGSGLTEVKSAKESISKSVNELQTIVSTSTSPAEFKQKFEKWETEYNNNASKLEAVLLGLESRLKANSFPVISNDVINSAISSNAKIGELITKMEQMESSIKTIKSTGNGSGKIDAEEKSKAEFRDFFYGQGAFATVGNMNIKAEYRGSQSMKTKADSTIGMTSDIDALGGYITRMRVLSEKITEKLIEITQFEQNATVEVIDGDVWQEPFELENLDEPVVTTEREDVQPTNVPKFGIIEGTLYPDTFYPAVTKEMLLKRTIGDAEAYLFDRLTKMRAKKHQRSYITGDGITGPAGILTDYGRGKSILTVNSGVADSIFGDYESFFGLIAELHSSFAVNAKFFMNRRTIANNIWTYKNDVGEFYVKETNPYQIRGYDIVDFPDMPDVEANAIPIMFGDLKECYVVLKNNWMIIVRDEVTTPKFVKFVTDVWSGGVVRQPQAMIRLRCSVG